MPIGDYDSISTMSNHAIIGVFRHAFFYQRRNDYPQLTDKHDSYCIRRFPDQIIVRVFNDGNEVYRCIFVPRKD
jgi:hypothetical protein